MPATINHIGAVQTPAVAGLTIAWWGVGLALVLNALSFVAVIGALLLMRTSELTPAPVARSKGAIRDGLRYVRARPEIMVVMFVVFMLGTFGLNFQLTNSLMATAVFVPTPRVATTRASPTSLMSVLPAPGRGPNPMAGSSNWISGAPALASALASSLSSSASFRTRGRSRL
ncbi:MAG: MFS transporter [candidate division NC10 bacterium]